MHPKHFNSGKYFCKCHGFKLCMGARYLEGYIMDNKSNSNWLRYRTLTWEKILSRSGENPGKYPQESYFAVVRAIQIYWILLQRTTWDTGDSFMGMKKMIRENFFALSFLWKEKKPLTYCRSSKYDADKDGKIVTPESSDVRRRKVHKLSAGECGTDLIQEEGKKIIQLRPLTDAQVRNAWW